ncbi:carboxypeptidase-like regulatory domain-containing protein [Hymenobacter sp. UV11]|uniref:carboxypeptidase-like regulatory domain-containing protein n=1 Tax=Hymenobacter sp. UV11 TaxID=1849735 RepID=UPI00105EDA85|nr:carboxypeptidase-like regulatory domain-containing protein [Hymenobacter sp. UV11]TDN37408.1 hypothetical protein A8B98_02380 [Hymenobacter sp. UV11]TFZ68596.1 carboxypeptidase-like regulatory domain-containing protein [Hymenobacter sp. UV11]
MTAIRYLLLAAAALLSHQAAAQGLVTGKVLDRQTRQPVPYASVVVAGTTQGTTTNAEGEFGLRVARLPAKVLAFSLGYGRDSVTVAAAGPTPPLALQAAPVALPAVEPTSYAANLLAHAYRVLQRTNARKLYGQAFYRQVTYLDQQPTQLLEMLWQTKASSAGLEGTALSQGRFAEKKGMLISFNNLSNFTKSLTLYSPANDTTKLGSVLSPEPTKMYTLRLLGVSQSGGQSLASIEFVGKPKFNPQHVRGIITVDVDTYQLLRFQVGIDIAVKSNNPTFKFKDERMNYDLVFAARPDGAAPDHMLVTLTQNIGRMLKPDLQMHAVGFTYFYDWQPTAAAVTYEPAGSKQKDLDAIKQKPYDADFWRNNPVVKRTPLEEETIRSFEQSKSFGTILTK